MSESEKKESASYSADYRGMHPEESAAPAPKRETAASLGPDRMDNDTEIDDFLPDSDFSDVEEMLTKWDRTEPEEEAKAPEKPVPRARRKSGKYRWGLAAGTAVLLLAVTGVVMIAVQAGARIHAAVTDDSRLRAYDSMLTVIVAQDPQPFASPDLADPEFVQTTAIWKAILDNGSGYTTFDDAGRTVVPLGDVAEECRKLFGPDCSLQPSVPSAETFYTYDAEKTQYYVALYSLTGTYEPYTISAKNEGDSVVLRVGYLSPSDSARKTASSGAVSSSTPRPVKYMDYVVKTNAATGLEYVYAVRASS